MRKLTKETLAELLNGRERGDEMEVTDLKSRLE